METNQILPSTISALYKIDNDTTEITARGSQNLEQLRLWKGVISDEQKRAVLDEIFEFGLQKFRVTYECFIRVSSADGLTWY